MEIYHTVNKSSPCFERPPLIIWGDNHESPINYASVHHSLVYLQSMMGCNHFSFEYDSNRDLQWIINKTATSLKNAIDHKSIVDSKTLDKYGPSQQEEVNMGARMVPALESRLALFNEVGRLGLTYLGVDMNFCDDRTTHKISPYLYGTVKYAERNEVITNNLTKLVKDPTTSGILAMVGLRHFIALSEAFRNNEEVALKRTVLFLYVCNENDPDRSAIASAKQELENNCQFKFTMISDGENSQNEIRTFLESNCKYRPIAIKNLLCGSS